MPRALILSLCALVMLLSSVAATQTQAQGESGLRLITETLINGSRFSKYPDVAAANGLVYVAANAEKRDALLWSKADGALDFPGPFRFGSAESDPPDYATTAVALGPDGSVYVSWINQSQSTVYMRQRTPDGVWGPQRTVAGGRKFPVTPEIAVVNNTIFVAWREPDDTAKYRFSTNGGANWSGVTNLGSNNAYASLITFAVGPKGELAVTWTAGFADRLQIYVGIWDGAGFVLRRVTTLSDDYSDSSATYGPDGQLYVAWRGETGGVYYAERKPDGSYPPSRLAGGKPTGVVNVSADELGNLHFTWILRGINQLFYVFREANGTFRGPIASGNTGSIFNARAAASAVNTIYNHVVMEEFGGSTVRTRYSLFQSESSIFSATPTIEGGVDSIGGKTSVSVAFTLKGSVAPDQVRVNWGAPPTSANEWRPFSNPLTLEIPSAVLNDTSCQPVTLYTQVQNTVAGIVEDQPKSDAILIDGIVQSDASIINPFLVSDTPGGAMLQAVVGASAGEPGYTRVPLVHMSVRGGADCTGLKTVSVGKNAQNFETVLQIDNAGYEGFVPLPDLLNLKNGSVPITVQIRDNAGNVKNQSFTIMFDDKVPVIDLAGSGAVTITPDKSGDLFQDISFTALKVSDNLYGGRGFWGVWVAVSRTPVAKPLDSTTLKWGHTAVPGTSSTFTLQDVSLASGLAPSQVTPGTYYIYIRVLDGAGNPSDEVIALSVESQVVQPVTRLPIVIR